MIDIKLIATMQAVFILCMLLSVVLFVCIDSFSNNNLPTNQKQRLIANQQQHIIRQTSFTHLAITDDDTIDLDNITTQNNRLLVFGLGNVGSLVAERGSSLHQVIDGVPFFQQVYGTTRTTKDIDGVQTIGFDDYQELEKTLPSCTHVLVTIPPLNPPTDIDINSSNQHYCDPVLNNTKYPIKDILPANTWIGFISSTSVYGNHDGEWVTEDSETKCEAGTRAEVYLTAENEWRTAAKECNWKLHIFRCAGLYSNNRSALHTILKNGLAVETIDNASTTTKIGSPTSRIHEEDVSRVVLSAMNYNGSISGGTNLWNLADDEPEVRSKVMAYGAQLLEGANLLPFFAESSSTQTVTTKTTKPKQSERASRRLLDRKRVDAQRMKDLLLPDGKLLYPTYREGLKSILNSNRKKWSSDSATLREKEIGTNL